MISTGDELVLKRVAGGSITDRRPLFSTDSMSLYIIWEDGVRQYSVTTGQFVQKLEAPTDSPLVCLQTSPLEPGLLFAISSTGELVSWKQESGVLDYVKVLNLELKSGKKVIGFYLTSHKSVIVVIEDVEKAIQKYIKCGLKGTEKEFLTVIGQPGDFSSSMGGAGDEEFLATIHVCNLRIISLKTLAKQKHKVNPEWGNLTCVRAHHSQKMIATCDQTGRILLWRDFDNPKQAAVKSLHHWHKLPVNDVVFTGLASCMYSGGSETCLVKWWLDGDSKDFLTNMGATIKNLALSPDNKYVAVGMADNAIHIIDPAMKYHKTIQHVSVNFEQREGVAPVISRMAIDPRSKALVVNGRSGHVQFFSVEKQEYLFKVDVINQNYLNRERNVDLVNSEVVLTALSGDGDWLVTVEERDDGSTHTECRIKFWNWHWQDMFKLSTSIENPHQSKVNDIMFQPLGQDNLRLISTGMNKKFIVWNRNPEDNSWKFEFIGRFDQLIPRPVDFPVDGSTFGIGFEHNLTVWGSDDFDLKCCLSRPGATDPIKFIKFGNSDSSRFVACASSKAISIWDLLSLQLSRIINVRVSCLVANPLNNHMAAFTIKNELIVFSPSESKPIFRKNLSIEGNVASALFWPTDGVKRNQVSWQRQALLYFMTNEQEIFTLVKGGCEDEADGTAVVLIPVKDHSHFATPLAAMVAKQSLSHVKKAEPLPMWQQQVDSHQGSYLKMMCETPAHMLPPMPLLVGELVQEYLNFQCGPVNSQSNGLNEKDEQAELMQVDADSADSDEELEKKKAKKNKTVSSSTVNNVTGENKFQKVVNEESKWVETLFSSILESEEN